MTKYSVLPMRPPYSKLGLSAPETAAVDADTAALLQRITARRLDIDDAGGAQAKLCGQRTGNQGEAADKIGVPRTWPKPDMPSGKVMPLMRYCTLACSLRTWMSPLTMLSCETPGACSKHRVEWGIDAPCGSVSINARFMSKVLAPNRGDRLSRAVSNCVFWAARVALLSGCGDGAVVVGVLDRGRGGADRWLSTTISGSAVCACASLTTNGIRLELASSSPRTNRGDMTE